MHLEDVRADRDDLVGEGVLRDRAGGNELFREGRIGRTAVEALEAGNRRYANRTFRVDGIEA